ncbi:unnamed protein product [Haemonchus placei]|uniref:Uncharacterized protein n=2 Tax=Haemonchus TaxID=6288 RepID=A0A3P7Z6Z2_HAEPC|nr:unnamed protein product [Haemonchus placei]
MTLLEGTQPVEGEARTLTTVKEWDAAYETEESLLPGEDKEQFVIESEEYEAETQKQPISSPTKTELTLLEGTQPVEGEARTLTTVKAWDAAYETEESLLPGKDEEQFVIESEEYEAETQKQPISSPTKTEQTILEERQPVEGEARTLTTVKELDARYETDRSLLPDKGEEQFVIESKEYEAETQRQPISSPTKTELTLLEGTQPVEVEARTLTTVKELDAAYETEESLLPGKDEEQFVIESEEYEAETQKQPISSPTKTEPILLEGTEPVEGEARTLTTVKEWDATYETEEGKEEGLLPGKDEEQFVIESEEYETETQKQPISSPTRTEQTLLDSTQPLEGEAKILTTVEELDVTYKTEKPLSVGEGEELSVIESEDYVTDRQRRLLPSPTKIEGEEVKAPFTMELPVEKDADSRSYDMAERKEPPLQMVNEEALENVVRLTFRDTDELDSPEKQSTLAPSSYPDEQLPIAGDEEWKVYDNKGEVLEEFSNQLTQELILEAESNASIQPSHSPPMVIKQESSNDVMLEHEVDYQSDLQEKLDILAEESRGKVVPVQDDQLEVINETEHEHEPEEEHDIEQAATRLADEAINAALEHQEDAKTLTSTSESNVYHTATEQSKDDQYDTCVTSQDTYDSAQEWTSQESEYTTAASGATSRLSEAEERHGSVTPLAILSPVDSDRQFTANQDFDDVVPIRRFGIDDTARSTPDVPLQVTIEEEEEESESTLPTSPSGILLAPQMDPGRPVSPVPPSRQVEEDEEFFVFVEKVDDKEREQLVGDEQKTEKESPKAETPLDSKSEKTYTRQYSDMSSESRADTVIHHEKGDTETVADAEEFRSSYEPMSGSSESLDKTSARSSTAEKRDTSSSASPPKESEEILEPEQITESPSSEDSAKEKTSDNEEGFVICSFMEDTPIVEGELETVEEEPEDVESVNGSGNSSVGVPSDSLALIGKYKHVSSDNVSLTSLQEFERLEQVVINRGEASLSASEIELYAAGKLRSGEGSVSSLAEFEKLEKELAANISPQEDAAMLPEIREESEVEDMSVRDDDEEDHSETEVKTRPIDEEDLRAATPIASPVDSLEREPIPVSSLPILETSTDSLEPSYERIETQTQRDSDTSSLAEYEVITRLGESERDSLENIPHERDSLLEGASQDIMTSQDTQALLSGDTVGTYQEHDDDDRDSLGGDMDTMLRDYPTTLTTFETTAIRPDGTVQTISRRVETRVRDPVMSHVTFTGTESEERVRELPLEEQFETVDAEGNVTRTVCRRYSPPHP